MAIYIVMSWKGIEVCNPNVLVFEDLAELAGIPCSYRNRIMGVCRELKSRRAVIPYPTSCLPISSFRTFVWCSFLTASKQSLYGRQRHISTNSLGSHFSSGFNQLHGLQTSLAMIWYNNYIKYPSRKKSQEPKCWFGRSIGKNQF
jgi:hypothetical protein